MFNQKLFTDIRKNIYDKKYDDVELLIDKVVQLDLQYLRQKKVHNY